MKTTFTLILLFLIQSLTAQFSNVRMYAFGHSLMDHVADPAVPDTNIMYWINDISQEANNTFATGGQFGFLTNHDNLPPSSNWGYSGITGVWDSDTESFSDANINTILITAANFIQYVSPTSPHPLDNSTTVIQSTETIFDWVNAQESNVKYYIYGNWPEMDLQSPFPPTTPLQNEIDDFHNTTISTFTDWWKLYQDEMLNSRPALNSRLIPVGMIISKILRDVIPNQIAFDDLYEDSAPHGKPSIYFLAGMITYMAVYEENIPSTYIPNSTVHSAIINNLNTIRNFAWNELLSFNLANGDSRVFYSTTTNVAATPIDAKNAILYPNPTKNQFEIRNLYGNQFKISIYTNLGQIIQVIDTVDLNNKLTLNDLQNGVYFIHIENKESKEKIIKKLIIQN